MTKFEVNRAVRDAVHRLNEWNETTGVLTPSYEGEFESLIEDAVHIGIRAALGLPYIGVEARKLRPDVLANDRPDTSKELALLDRNTGRLGRLGRRRQSVTTKLGENE